MCNYVVHDLHNFYRATNVEKSSEVEIQYIEHASIEKETEAQGDDRDEINVYENVSDEIHRMSTCPAYDTIEY